MMRRPPRSTPFPSTTLFRSPKNAHTHNNLAHALRATGQLDAAAVEFKEAIRLKPDYAGAHNDLAWLLATCDDLKLREDRKRTRLNSSHSQISYADFCLKQKNLVAAPHARGDRLLAPDCPAAQLCPSAGDRLQSDLAAHRPRRRIAQRHSDQPRACPPRV